MEWSGMEEMTLSALVLVAAAAIAGDAESTCAGRAS